MIQEEEEEDDNMPPEYVEALDAALAHRGLKKGSNHAPMGFNNPAFNNIDLWWE